jgi:hypothetical protein
MYKLRLNFMHYFLTEANLGIGAGPPEGSLGFVVLQSY